MNNDSGDEGEDTFDNDDLFVDATQTRKFYQVEFTPKNVKQIIDMQKSIIDQVSTLLGK